MTQFLGVLGGMGPIATADFLRKLAEKTEAANDQEHIPVLLYGDCTTPDRTANIVGDGPSPLPQLLEGIKFLCDAGVSTICIPCNSAHRWYDEMQNASSVPIVHIVKASASQVRTRNVATRSVGVLSTFGTYRMGMYRDTLAALGYDVVLPSAAEFETLISPAIAMNKANIWANAEPFYEKAASMLFERGAEIVILGCTEIPSGMATQLARDPGLFVDSNDALVDSVLERFSTDRAH
jgi:aspartate racemase